MHGIVPAMNSDIEAEWEAALADANISPSRATLYTFAAGSDLGGGRQAVYQSPGDYILPPPAQRFLEVLNEKPDLHRVGIGSDLESYIAAAVIRHELEHARQFERHGRGIFNLQDLIVAACWEKTGRVRVGGGFLTNIIPPELDANAAAARFVWSRHAAAAEAYLNAPHDDHQVLFRYERGPEPLETLVWRTLAYAATIADHCEAVSLRVARKTFRDFLDEHLPGAGPLWEQLRPQ